MDTGDADGHSRSWFDSMRIHIMKHYKTVQRSAEVVDHETCDKCGKQVEYPSSFQVNDFKLEWRFGDAYPDGGSGEVKELDLCFQCRADFFVLLETAGYKVQSREYDY